MQDVIVSESATQPAQELSCIATPDGPSVEHQRLAGEIRRLWSAHVEAKSAAARVKSEVKDIRRLLVGPLSEMKTLLAKPGRNGGWSAFLRSEGIAKAVAEGLARKGREPAGTQPEAMPASSPSLGELSGGSPAASCESGDIAAEVAGPAPQAPEGDTNSADAPAAEPSPQLSGDIPAAAGEPPASVPTTDPPPQPSEGTPAAIGEPAVETTATPLEPVHAAAVADAGGGAVV